MHRVSLLFFKADCMGCHACEVACKQEHRLPSGPRLVRVLERASDFIPIHCRHCARAQCGEACPFGAMQFHEEKEVAVKCDLCSLGLKAGIGPACSSVCPTGCVFWGDNSSLHRRIDSRLGPSIP
jgi:Fe-S-cluster-containing dehydrogenase component